MSKHDFLYLVWWAFHQREIIASAVQGLQEQWASTTNQPWQGENEERSAGKGQVHLLAAVDDSDAVSQQVSLVHEVSSEDDGPAELVPDDDDEQDDGDADGDDGVGELILDQQVPDCSARVRVHPCRGLVQNNHPVQ